MVKRKPITNILTVDVEEAFHRNDVLLTPSQQNLFRGRLEEQVQRLITLLTAKGQKGTFFVLGEVAKRYPDIVRILADMKFEIGLHGYRHNLVYEQDVEDFRHQIKSAKSFLEDLVGVKIIGFRAPSWSITKESLWALHILSDLGFLYDSSILPARSYLGGIYSCNPYIHYRSEVNIIEVPPSVMNIGGFRLAFSGGLYLRVLPYQLIRHFIKRFNKKGIPVVIYLHPWELDRTLPRVKIGWKGRFSLYYNLDVYEYKVKQLLEEFSFASISEVLRERGFLC